MKYFRALAEHLVTQYCTESLLFIVEILQYRAVIQKIADKNNIGIHTSIEIVQKSEKIEFVSEYSNNRR